MAAIRGAVSTTNAVSGLGAKSAAAGSPLEMIQQLSSLTANDRPLGQAMAPGGPLDQIVGLSETLSSLAPNVERMSSSIDLLQDTVGLLSAAVGPLGDLAGRLPGRWLRRCERLGVGEWKVAVVDRATASTRLKQVGERGRWIEVDAECP